MLVPVLQLLVHYLIRVRFYSKMFKADVALCTVQLRPPARVLSLDRARPMVSGKISRLLHWQEMDSFAT
jgi:hypothetical protein